MASGSDNCYSNTSRNMIEFLECKLCRKPFTNPRQLPCRHISCSDCLRQLITELESFSCPQPHCDKISMVPDNGVLGFSVAFHINALQDFIQHCGPKRRAILCYNDDNEKNHEQAGVKCLECNVYYCTSCNDDHRMAAIAKIHETIPLSNLTEEHFVTFAQKQVTVCQRHPDCSLTYFCKNTECQTPACEKCCITKHKLHEVIDIEEASAKCRSENKTLLVDFEDATKTLESKKQEINDLMMGELDRRIERHKSLISNAENSRDDKFDDYRQQLLDTKDKISSLNMTMLELENVTKFSPHDVIVKQHKEMKQHAIRALEETVPPELWVQNTAGVSSGEFVIDMKMELNFPRPYKIVHCLNGCISTVALLKDFFIALCWTKSEEPTEFFVSGENPQKAEQLKMKLKKFCPQAYRLLPMMRDGHEVLVITESTNYSFHHIKIMYINDGKCLVIQLHETVCPLALAVDRHNDVIFTDFSTPIAIRKLRKDDVQTLFKNIEGTNFLENPCYISINVNNDIIVSDNKKKLIAILDAGGKVLTIYDKLTDGACKTPRGVCTNEKGHIYVCDINGHCIHQLDMRGAFLNYVVTQHDGLWYPVTVNYSEGMLIVGQGDGYVKYFKLRKDQY